MKTTRCILLFVVALALEVGGVHAGSRIQYFVGYGIYPPKNSFTPDTVSTTAGTGLLAVNGSHRALIQLIWAGPNNVPDPLDIFSSLLMDGDDVVLDSRIIEVGVDGVDEWGYTSTLPPAFVCTNSVPMLVYVRVHQDATPGYDCHWYYDSPLAQLANQDSTVPNDAGDAMATVITIETGSEAVPASGVVLDQCAYYPIEWPMWRPDPPDVMKISHIEFKPEASGLSCPIPYSYSFSTAYGADMVLPGGGWNWQPLEEGTDYVVANGVVTLATTGEGRPVRRMIRLGLIHDF